MTTNWYRTINKRYSVKWKYTAKSRCTKTNQNHEVRMYTIILRTFLIFCNTTMCYSEIHLVKNWYAEGIEMGLIRIDNWCPSLYTFLYDFERNFWITRWENTLAFYWVTHDCVSLRLPYAAFFQLQWIHRQSNFLIFRFRDSQGCEDTANCVGVSYYSSLPFCNAVCVILPFIRHNNIVAFFRTSILLDNQIE